MTQRPVDGFHPLAALAAIAFPGAGHLVLGQTWRALGAAAGVLGLFFGGLLIGGIDVVDSREDPVWFYGEALVGPIAWGVNYAHQHHFKAMGPQDISGNPAQFAKRPQILRSGYPGEVRFKNDQGVWSWRPATQAEIAAGEGPPNQKSVARVNEIGTLYATLAGMLNLIIILDALVPTKFREDEGPSTGEEAGLGVAAVAIAAGAAGGTPS